eukprot:scaffold52861_cov74-Phaeocystis_antarctica.AAC.3
MLYTISPSHRTSFIIAQKTSKSVNDSIVRSRPWPSAPSSIPARCTHPTKSSTGRPRSPTMCCSSSSSTSFVYPACTSCVCSEKEATGSAELCRPRSSMRCECCRQ